MIKQLLQKGKTLVNIFLSHKSNIRKEVDCKHKWYGNMYGGFYVYPDNLNSESIIYSFGIGEDISFDNTIIEKHDCKVFAFDPTPKSINWLRKQDLPSNFAFYEYGINSKTGFVNFNLPKNEDHVSGSAIMHKNVDQKNVVSVLMKTLSDITEELGHKHINVLKMDIEGSEYDVIDNILASPIEIDQILIELHERFFPDGKYKTHKLLKSLKDNGYAIFAVSDSLDEISFIKI